MSKKKLFLGILLIIISFTMIAFINFIYLFSDSGKIQKELNVNFKFLKEEKKDIAILYFGYTGCSNICIIALNQLNNLYKTIDKKRVSVYFINLLTNADKNLTNDYVKSFNKDFTALNFSKQELFKITTKLKVNFAPSLLNKEEINHTGFLYLFQKNDKGYKQKYVYTNTPYDIDLIKKDINKILKDK
ncbi:MULTISPECIES: SCO family protein [Arcobacteraceae]|uniref:Photosynthetic protein synthase I n=1 Tax=Poseidonibacter parvus TaxID=1850254 RepID=A0A1P8KJP5_9BACT|nr:MULTISPECIES: SCO family protein [Arcobacteraceae]APW64781.1 hypothetical protein LPB137_02425 [Poseidonibacter parvus]